MRILPQSVAHPGRRTNPDEGERQTARKGRPFVNRVSSLLSKGNFVHYIELQIYPSLGSLSDPSGGSSIMRFYQPYINALDELEVKLTTSEIETPWPY